MPLEVSSLNSILQAILGKDDKEIINKEKEINSFMVSYIMDYLKTGTQLSTLQKDISVMREGEAVARASEAQAQADKAEVAQDQAELKKADLQQKLHEAKIARGTAQRAVRDKDGKIATLTADLVNSKGAVKAAQARAGEATAAVAEAQARVEEAQAIAEAAVDDFEQLKLAIEGTGYLYDPHQSPYMDFKETEEAVTEQNYKPFNPPGEKAEGDGETGEEAGGDATITSSTGRKDGLGGDDAIITSSTRVAPIMKEGGLLAESNTNTVNKENEKPQDGGGNSPLNS